MQNSKERQNLIQLMKNKPIWLLQRVGFNDLTSLHNEWLKSFLYSDVDQTLQAHRGSYKTTTLSGFFALHTLLFPKETMIYFRKTGGDVNEIARQTVNIMNTPVYHEMVKILYGHDFEFTKLSSSEISTNIGGSRVKGASQIVGLGIGTSITGKHADIIVTDDIVNVNDRISRAERERTKIAYQEMQNIKNRGGRFINTGTPWHKEDCFTLMPNIHRFDCYETGLITDSQLDYIRKSMSPSLFAANYELKHIASEDIIFLNPQLGADPQMAEQGWAHVDAAFYGEDYTALTIMGIHDGKFYVFGKTWRKHIDDVMDEVVEWYNQFKVTKIFIELNADKGYVANKLKARGLRVSAYNENQNKYIKIVSYLKFEWEDVIFVKGTDDKYIQQICDYNENAEHDDCPDSLASLLRIKGKRKNDGGILRA